MASPNADAIIRRYLKRLDREMGAFPATYRDEVLDEIREHIAEARAAGETDADVLRILDRLGDPKRIAAEARERFDLPPAHPAPADYVALVLLALGVSVIAFLAAIYLITRSAVWSRRDKVIGAVVPLIALPLGFLAGSDRPWLVVAVASTIPLTALYLALRMHNRSRGGLALIAVAAVGVALGPLVLVGLSQAGTSHGAVYGVVNGRHVCQESGNDGVMHDVSCDSLPTPDGGWGALEAANATPSPTPKVP
jgi:hypothetical protein